MNHRSIIRTACALLALSTTIQAEAGDVFYRGTSHAFVEAPATTTPPATTPANEAAALQILQTGSLAPAYGSQWSLQLKASGGKAPYSLTVAGAQPGSVAIANDGSTALFTGASRDGSFPFSASVVDADGRTTTSTATVVVPDTVPTLGIKTVPTSQTEVAYGGSLALTLEPQGGMGPYVFSNTTGLPAQTSMTSAGVATGTPAPGTYSVSTTLTDAVGKAVAVGPLALTVLGPTPGTVMAWGENDVGQLGRASGTLPAPSPNLGALGLTAINGGTFGTFCGMSGGKAWCWGRNNAGQLGPKNATSNPVPVSIGTYASATAGSTWTCVRNASGSPFCLGNNYYGTLGNSSNFGTPTANESPLSAGGTAFASITAGGNHACGLTAAGKAWCWGYNAQGQLGNASTFGALTGTSTSVAAASNLTFTSLAAGSGHTCGLVAGKAWCWGLNASGQTGGTVGSANSYTATNVSSTLSFGQIVAGSDFSCGLAADGKAWCWGSNASSRLGVSGPANSATPVEVAAPAFASLAAKNNSACGLTSDGTAWCWGSNSSGQLGRAASAGANLPQAVDVAKFSSIALSDSSMVAVVR